MSAATNKPDAPSRYIIGIDLGTTNCVLSYLDTAPGSAAAAAPAAQVLSVPQWDSEGRWVEAPVLPSFYYLPPKAEWRRGQLALPMLQTQTAPADQDPATAPDAAVGRFARLRSSQVPGRVIHSAKSWLCHPGIDPQERILPWHVGELVGEERRSPVEVSAAYLAHLRQSWEALMRGRQEPSSFAEQEIIITVPASFDEAAQRLTLQAALLAGYPAHVRLLEEPQAAFYHWLSTAARPHAQAGTAQTVLVCDVGGGTSDFSLFRVENGEGEEPTITRLAVSEHLLLGGDNIDLALAHILEERLAGTGRKLSARAWAQLVFATRQLKEQALSEADGASLAATPPSPDDELFVSIAGDGAGLFAAAMTVTIRRAEIHAHVLGGFLPLVERDAKPQRQRAALLQIGLPYAFDSALTKHLAAFLAGRDVDCVLYNGGTLKPAALRTALTAQIAAWQGRPPVVLDNPAMDLAVALGATHYGALRRAPSGLIGGGYARSLYVEVAGADGAGPRLMCIVPKGYDGRAPLKIDDLHLKLRTDRPARFQLYSSTTRTDDTLGQLLPLAAADFHPLPALHTRLDFGTSAGTGQSTATLIDVSLEVSLADTGILYLHCVQRPAAASAAPPRRWQLDFNLRATGRPSVAAGAAGTTATHSAPSLLTVLDAARLQQAYDRIEAVYGKKKLLGPPPQAKNLARDLEDLLKVPRDTWDTPFLRALWPHLASGLTRRNRSLGHETSWLYLAGYALRPGYGYELDEWRLAELWRAYELGLAFPKEKAAEEQWWILWRRVAGGLSRAQQEKLFERIFPALRKGEASSPELLMLAGSLERIDMGQKIRLGQHLAQQIGEGRQQFINQRVWALARIASRVPLYGGAQSIVRPEVVGEWFGELGKLTRRDAAYAKLPLFLAQAGRVVLDREYDLAADLREAFLAKMLEAGATPEQRRVVEGFVPVDDAARTQLFGESLPAGLVLAT